MHPAASNFQSPPRQGGDAAAPRTGFSLQRANGQPVSPSAYGLERASAFLNNAAARSSAPVDSLAAQLLLSGQGQYVVGRPFVLPKKSS